MAWLPPVSALFYGAFAVFGTNSEFSVPNLPVSAPSPDLVLGKLGPSLHFALNFR